jgi:hypothetical protein
MVKSVVFTFVEHVSEKNQDQMRDQILVCPGVQNVGRISPNATKPALRRLWFAEVIDDAAAADLVTRLRQNADIQSANIPVERGLL